MEWIKALEDSKVNEGQLTTVSIFGKTITITKVAGRYFAFDDTCSHHQCSLGEGFLDGLTVECPCHGGQFNIETGAVLRLPAVTPISAYKAKVEDGFVWVEV